MQAFLYENLTATATIPIPAKTSKNVERYFRQKVVVILDQKTLKPTVVNMPLSRASVVGMIAPHDGYRR